MDVATAQAFADLLTLNVSLTALDLNGTFARRLTNVVVVVLLLNVQCGALGNAVPEHILRQVSAVLKRNQSGVPLDPDQLELEYQVSKSWGVTSCRRGLCETCVCVPGRRGPCS